MIMNKEQYKEKAIKIIDEVSDQINELKAKKESLKEDVKIEYDENINNLETKRLDLKAKYLQLEKANEDKWEEAKEAFSSATHSFKEGLDKLKSILTLFIIALLFTSCGSSSEKEKETSLEDVKEEMTDVVDVSNDLASEKWDKLNKQVEDIGDNLAEKTREAEKKYNRLSTDLKEKLNNKKQKLDEQNAELNKKVDEFQAAADDKKEDLIAEIEQLKTALDRSVSTFEKEMEENSKQ